MSDSKPLWASRTVAFCDRDFMDRGEYFAHFRDDGNLVVHHGDYERWNSDTRSSDGAVLVMQDDGDLVSVEAVGLTTY